MPSTTKHKRARAFRGSDNVFVDLGVRGAQTELAKADLVIAIARLIRQRKSTQTKVAALLGLPQPKVSALLAGETHGFSAERLMHLLTRLGQDIHISIVPPRKVDGVGVIRVSSLTRRNSSSATLNAS
ncbi:MAG: XRE family transcriptional regulator [Candidatus Eremiobacteraeota bacterium]|nr:XRE family transcriptional regulator [Candidatus Eremiobacteraeota bacterium]MBC5826789.1 XRE family transcriptional regulator [Candidatus Eremiobacteraeota bacterium]